MFVFSATRIPWASVADHYSRLIPVPTARRGVFWFHSSHLGRRFCFLSDRVAERKLGDLIQTIRRLHRWSLSVPICASNCLIPVKQYLGWFTQWHEHNDVYTGFLCLSGLYYARFTHLSASAKYRAQENGNIPLSYAYAYAYAFVTPTLHCHFVKQKTCEV